MGYFEKLWADVVRVLFENARWTWLTNGLKNTVIITLCAVLFGMALGFFLGIIRITHDKLAPDLQLRARKGGADFFGYIGLKFANAVAKMYLTIIRGTPVMVQLLIIYFVIFASVSVNKTFVAILAFGLNSAAYVAEIIRGGIMAVDNGQMEAGRSLGFSYPRTMLRIILPQAFKNVLPSLGNEVIVLLKETSVASVIAVEDLTYGGTMIRSITYSAFLPLIAVALIYLVVVIGLTRLLTLLERRLRTSDH